MLLRLWHRLHGRRPVTVWPYLYKPGRFPKSYLADDARFWQD